MALLTIINSGELVVLANEDDVSSIEGKRGLQKTGELVERRIRKDVKKNVRLWSRDLLTGDFVFYQHEGESRLLVDFDIPRVVADASQQKGEDLYVDERTVGVIIADSLRYPYNSFTVQSKLLADHSRLFGGDHRLVGAYGELLDFNNIPLLQVYSSRAKLEAEGLRMPQIRQVRLRGTYEGNKNRGGLAADVSISQKLDKDTYLRLRRAA